MLHLEPRVHLHEVKIANPHARLRLAAPRGGARLLGAARRSARPVLLADELDGAGTDVVHGARRGHGGLAHLAAALLGHAGRRRLFEHLLVAALHRAVALEQVDAVAVRVEEHLDLDVARALHVALDQHGVVAEAVDRLALAGRQRRVELLAGQHHAHALAAAAGARLDQHRVADAVGLAPEQRRILVGRVVAGHEPHAGLFHQLLGLGLQAHRADRRRRRADERDARVGAGLRELLVLAEEAIARVDGLRTGRLGRLDDAFPAQVAVARRGLADAHGLVAGGHVAGVGVGVGIDGDALDAQAARGRRDSAGNLAAVGDQDLGEHGVSSFVFRSDGFNARTGRAC